MKHGKCINREISWLEFNSRVLDEAADKGNPLLERLKFLAIFSSNLDEFFMVRVAEVMHHYEGGIPFDTNPSELLDFMRRKVRELIERQYKYLNDEILPALAEKGIEISECSKLNVAQLGMMRKYFISEIHPVLTPIAIDGSHPFPLIKNTGLELLVRLVKEGEEEERFAIIEVPTIIQRFVTVEKTEDRQLYINIGDLIRQNIDLLLSGCRIIEISPFRVTRDMDFYLDEDRVGDILSEIQEELQKTTRRRIIRLEIFSKMTDKSRKWLETNLQVKTEDVYLIPGLLDLKGFFRVTGNRDFPELIDHELPPLPSLCINEGEKVFDAISRNGSFILHHPYESFSPVIKMLEEAAEDPDVLAIKQTLYRVGNNSPIVKALISLALNRKQVTVLIELKARFDEEHNIAWAMELAEAGAHVIYGIAGLKVHCKALLIVRREAGGINRYVHLGTGNYNDKTAKLYTDIGLFCNDKMLANDISALFNVITGFSKPPVWNKIMVAPFNLRERIIYLINRESRLATKENPGHIIIKANSIIDPEMIECLYNAAKKNVKIDLIIRGVCGINPFSNKDAAKNINVVSILDRFLEHSRIYYFRNNGAEEYFIGSSDLMPRNLDRRIEILFPIDKKEIRREIDIIINCALADRRKGRKLIKPNTYSSTVNAGRYEKLRSQIKLYNFYKNRYKEHLERIAPQQEIKVFKSLSR